MEISVYLMYPNYSWCFLYVGFRYLFQDTEKIDGWKSSLTYSPGFKPQRVVPRADLHSQFFLISKTCQWL
jgi:hypothetical protein